MDKKNENFGYQPTRGLGLRGHQPVRPNAGHQPETAKSTQPPNTGSSVKNPKK